MENTKKIIEAFFNSKDKIVYGFDVLQTFYKNVCAIIGENKTIPHKVYPLLSSLNGSMQDVFCHVDLNYLCDEFHWFSFTQNVLTTSDLMSQNEKQAEIRALIQLNALIGKKLANCNSEVKKRWYDCLHVFNCRILEQKHQEVISKCIFSFIESQILFDNHNLVSDYFYDRLLKDENNISECFIRVFLLTSCYLYYLACRENEHFVNDRDKNLRFRSKVIVDQSIDKFKTTLVTIACRDVNLAVAPFNSVDIFNTNLFSYMKEMLQSCENYFFIEESKTFIMENVVDEFISHSLVFMKYKAPYLNIVIDKVMSGEQVKKLFLMFKTNRDIDKYHKSFLRFFNSIQYEKLYKLFIKTLENVYKKNLLKKKLESIKENYRIIEEKISQRISEVLGRQKDDICSNYATTILLPDVSIPNNIKLENLVDSFIDCILENIIISLYNRMKKSNEAVLFNRLNLVDGNLLESSRVDDENILKLIEKHKGHIYIGSDSLILPNDICFFWNRYDNAIKGLLKKYNGVAGHLGVFIDPEQFKIFIKDVSISRTVKTIQDSNAIEFNGMYKYAPAGIEMIFTKEELEEYLKSNEFVLNISANVGYDIVPETKVDFIIMEM